MHTHMYIQKERKEERGERREIVVGDWKDSHYNDTIISSLLLPWQHSNSTLIGPLSIATHNPSLPFINHIQRISHLIATLPVPNTRLISTDAKLTELDFDTSSTHTSASASIYSTISHWLPPLSLSPYLLVLLLLIEINSYRQTWWPAQSHWCNMSCPSWPVYSYSSDLCGLSLACRTLANDG